MNNSDQTSIEALQIGKVYWDGTRKLSILKNISFSAKLGEGIAILGPSGCGKTTLLNVLSGMDKPSEGTVRLLGVDLTKLNDSQKALFINENIGFVFQFYHLLPEFTALENVMLPEIVGKVSGGLPKIREKAFALLEKVGLKDRATHFPSELSGGEQQRVAIARALIREPKILFCDEPTGNLDPAMTDEILSLLKDFFKDKKKTVLMVTHDQKVARMAGRVWDLMTGEWTKKEFVENA